MSYNSPYYYEDKVLYKSHNHKYRVNDEQVILVDYNRNEYLLFKEDIIPLNTLNEEIGTRSIPLYLMLYDDYDINRHQDTLYDLP
jgi:hypothetical protein